MPDACLITICYHPAEKKNSYLIIWYGHQVPGTTGLSKCSFSRRNVFYWIFYLFLRQIPNGTFSVVAYWPCGGACGCGNCLPGDSAMGWAGLVLEVHSMRYTRSWATGKEISLFTGFVSFYIVFGDIFPILFIKFYNLIFYLVLVSVILNTKKCWMRGAWGWTSWEFCGWDLKCRGFCSTSNYILTMEILYHL